MAAEVETMFYTRETPWHGLGTRVIEAPSSKDALYLSGLDWNVEQEPIYTETGNHISGFKANIRDTDQKVLGVVTDRYRVIQNEEAFAFTDIDFANKQIHINKTYYRVNGEDVITTPKTEQSVRTIDIPDFLNKEIMEYTEKLYKYPRDARLFPMVAEAVQHKMKRNIEKAGVKKIRVHDLRHSHVAYLIHQGVAPLLIKQRLGHKDIQITLNTYGHLYPNEQKKLAEMLNGGK